MLHDDKQEPENQCRDHISSIPCNFNCAQQQNTDRKHDMQAQCYNKSCRKNINQSLRRNIKHQTQLMQILKMLHTAKNDAYNKLISKIPQKKAKV